MKKLLSFVLVLALCASMILALNACDLNDAKDIIGMLGNGEEGAEELNEEEWKEALAAPNFENVTIRYEYENEGTFQKQVMKTTAAGVYRAIE